jgi:hypothetical protein
MNQDKQDIKNQLGDQPDVFPVPQFYENTVQVVPNILFMQTRDTSDSMIWGRSEWGDNWGPGPSYVFTTHAIVPFNNIFGDYFANTSFIDTGATTATVSTSAGTATFTTGQILKSMPIAYLRQPINSANVVSVVDLTKGTLELSNNDGATWETVTAINAPVYFGTAADTDKLRYRFTASSAYTLTAPVIIQVNVS